MSRQWLSRQRIFTGRIHGGMLLLALFLGGLWYFSALSPLTEEENLLWRKVRSAQDALYAERTERGLEPQAGTDPWKTGFPGVEWSGITTTLGPLEAKRTAADPLWSVHALRTFRRLGLKAGDRVAVFSSSSFPGLVFSLLSAAESLDLSVLWVHSLGSSTWGANVEEFPWPEIALTLREKGFLSLKADSYTLGGGGEMGRGMSPEGRDLLREAAAREGVPLLEENSLSEITAKKTALLRAFSPRLVITVGGSAATFGGGEDEFPFGGYYPPEEKEKYPGKGVFQNALKEGIPVLHFLNLRSLAREAGIPYDGRPVPRFSPRGGPLLSGLGLLLFLGALYLFPRWKKQP